MSVGVAGQSGLGGGLILGAHIISVWGRPMFFRRKRIPPSRVFDERLDDVEHALFKAERCTPLHCDIDRTQLDGGLGWAAGKDANGWALDYFKDFCHHLGKFTDPGTEYFIGPWVMERRADPLDPRDYNDGPAIAVNFRLYYNACDVGIVRFKPSSWLATEEQMIRQAAVGAEIEYAPMLPYEHVFAFLMLLSHPLSLSEDGSPSDEHRYAVLRAMQSTLWEAQRLHRSTARLDFFHSGFAHISFPFKG